LAFETLGFGVTPTEGEGGVGVTTPLFEDSVRRVVLLYLSGLSGDGFTAVSKEVSVRSGEEAENVIADAEEVSRVDFLWSGNVMALSSLEVGCGLVNDRLEDPDVETVESDEEDGWLGWPSFDVGSCCSAWGLGADVDLFSWRSCGVLENA
jgi:hypothetical protein